ncbi:hypothetical protein M3I54_32035 [Paraburkholderia sp. CNPSo 3274]|uniref:hypothetical protein n=1 Tax=Paraburkholderia sp. CNPSo 3274 TaxID=2940932 RepID=UPI0020B84241|nr:hypothetical protein [Paraburkholderia sp. CNPSo 3274]MCP3711541.1 hypothetical protein [Paraburkholderia sp. CNPSo 3274]
MKKQICAFVAVVTLAASAMAAVTASEQRLALAGEGGMGYWTELRSSGPEARDDLPTATPGPSAMFSCRRAAMSDTQVNATRLRAHSPPLFQLNQRVATTSPVACPGSVVRPAPQPDVVFPVY